MKISCLSSLPLVRTVALGVAGILAVFSTGCASYVRATAGAPSSGVSREHAMSLAQLAASTVGGKVFTISATGSMKPTLDESSVVTIETIEFSDLRRGDIIIYRNESGTPIIHRLYEQVGNRWLVLGDNNPAIDRDAVTAQNFVGRVCAIFYTSGGNAASLSTAMASR